MPTLVRNLTPFFPILSSLLTLLGSDWVLDRPSFRGRTSWCTHLGVDHITCFDNTIHPAVFLGGRFLVGRRREQVPLVEARSEGRIRREASYIGNAPVSDRLSSRESRSQIFGHQLPPGIRPCRLSFHCNVAGTGRSPPCIIGG